MLDALVLSFTSALIAGAASLAAVSLPLLGALALLSFYQTMSLGMLSGSGSTGDALATLLLQALRIGGYIWLLLHFQDLATGALLTMLGWGGAASGSAISGETFLKPSALLDLGMTMGAPLHEHISTLGGLFWTKAPFLSLIYLGSFWVIVLAFLLIALALSLVLIEFYLSVLVATVFIPLGIWPPTAPLAEFSLGWLIGNLTRAFVTASLVGVARPLFVSVQFAPGTTPTAAAALVTAAASLLFGVLCWTVPNRAANLAGRGLGLSGHTVLASAATGARWGMMAAGGAKVMGAQAIRGASRMLMR